VFKVEDNRGIVEATNTHHNTLMRTQHCLYALSHASIRGQEPCHCLMSGPWEAATKAEPGGIASSWRDAFLVRRAREYCLEQQTRYCGRVLRVVPIACQKSTKRMWRWPEPSLNETGRVFVAKFLLVELAGSWSAGRGGDRDLMPATLDCDGIVRTNGVTLEMAY